MYLSCMSCVHDFSNQLFLCETPANANLEKSRLDLLVVELTASPASEEVPQHHSTFDGTLWSWVEPGRDLDETELTWTALTESCDILT